MDLMYFPALAVENRWPEKMAKLVLDKRLHANDINALEVLVKVAATEKGGADRPAVLAIVEVLQRRFPHRVEPEFSNCRKCNQYT